MLAFPMKMPGPWRQPCGSVLLKTGGHLGSDSTALSQCLDLFHAEPKLAQNFVRVFAQHRRAMAYISRSLAQANGCIRKRDRFGGARVVHFSEQIASRDLRVAQNLAEIVHWSARYSGPLHFGDDLVART